MATKVDKFDYNLPKELIALYPADKRDKCRLMMVDTAGKSITHHIFSDIQNPRQTRPPGTLPVQTTDVCKPCVFLQIHGPHPPQTIHFP